MSSETGSMTNNVPESPNQQISFAVSGNESQSKGKPSSPGTEPDDYTKYAAPDIEEVLIGALLVNQDLLPQVRAELKPADFWRGIHREVYESMMRLEEYDQHLVLEDLRFSQQLTGEKVRELRLKMTDWMCSGWSRVAVSGYCKKLRDYGRRRRLLTMAAEIREAAATAESAEDLISIARTRITELDAEGEELTPFTESLMDTILKIEQRAEGNVEPGLLTGFADLDEILVGLEPGLTFIAACTSMGKTMLSLNIVTNVALRLKGQKKPVFLFSLEMDKDQLNQRMLASVGQVSAKQIKSGKELNQNDWLCLSHAQNELNQCDIRIEEDAFTVSAIEASLSKAVASGETPALVVIDYIQQMNPDVPSKNGAVDRNKELEGISKRLRRLAKKIKVPMLVLSQLSRANSKRLDRRPQLSDLRDCGSLEQDADVVILLHREKYYNPDTPDGDVVEVNVAKHRQGEIGTIVLEYQPWCQTLTDSSQKVWSLPSHQKEKTQPTQGSRYGRNYKGKGRHQTTDEDLP